MNIPVITLAHNVLQLRIESKDVTIFAADVVVVKMQFFDDEEPDAPRLVGELTLEGDQVLELARHITGTLVRIGAQELNLELMKALQSES